MGKTFAPADVADCRIANGANFPSYDPDPHPGGVLVSGHFVFLILGLLHLFIFHQNLASKYQEVPKDLTGCQTYSSLFPLCDISPTSLAFRFSYFCQNDGSSKCKIDS